MRDEDKSREQLIQELADLRQQLAAREIVSTGDAALRESEARFRSLFEESPLSLWEEDFSAVRARLDALRRSGVSDFPVYFAEHPDEVARCASLVRIVDVNRATLELFGAPSKDAMLANLPSVFGEESYPAFAAELAALAEAKTRFQVETVNRRLDGARIAVELTWQVAPGHERDLAKVVVSIVDVTERRRAEAERERLLEEVEARASDLAFERDRLRTVLESIADAVVVCDASGFIIQANAAALTLLGAPSPETKLSLADYMSALQLRGPDGQQVPLDELTITRALHGMTERGREEVGVHPRTGARIHLLISAAPLRDADGHVVGAVEVATDVTRMRELADVAQRRAAELQGVLDNMVDAVFVVAPDGRIVLSNPAASRMFGISSFAGIGNLPSEFPILFRLRHPDGRPVESEEMATARALAGETVVDSEQVLRDPQSRQDRYVRVSASPIRDVEGKILGAVAVVRDVTALTELDRLKDEFLAVAAHELKTPVTIMKGYAQTLERASTDLPLPARRMVDAIDQGADRINRIVKDLLDISRLQAGQLELADERVDLAELAETVVDRFALTTSKHRLRVVQVDPAVVRGDRSRIEEVLADLLDNAVRYSPGGGDVDVAVRVEGDRAVVSVKDYGVGIPKEKQSHIFERFYRAHTRTRYDYGGMGVGLYIAREVIARHGGQMWFESEEGKGSTFYFSLPLA